MLFSSQLPYTFLTTSQPSKIYCAQRHPHSDHLLLWAPDDSLDAFPNQPQLTWDIKTVFWTYLVSDQTLYVQAVHHWCAFHDILSEWNRNRIGPNNRGVVLLSHLFGNAAAVCRTITQEIVDSDDVTSLTVNSVHRKEALSVVSDVYCHLQNLFRTLQRCSESFGLFKTRFNVQAHRFNGLSLTTTQMKP